MTTISISSTYSPDHVLVVGITGKDGAIEVHSSIDDCALVGSLEKILTTLKASTTPLSITTVVNPQNADTIVVAVGIDDDGSANGLRNMAAAAIRALAGRDHVSLAFAHSTLDQLTAIAQGVGLGGYEFTSYREAKNKPVGDVVLVTSLDGDYDTIISHAEIISSVTNRVRDLVNTAPNDLTTTKFAHIAKEEAEASGCNVTVIQGDQLEKDRLAGIAHVGAGSDNAPCLVRVEWKPENAKGYTALVGKGITFDSGGYSLKPATSMVEMKTDMGGAATVLGTLITAAKLGVQRHIVGWLCIAENMVSGSAGRPDDVITYRNGLSVEINNTDAEGRLVMADGLIMACEENPDEVIDIATLTGAQMVALGERTTGIMGCDEIRDGLCEVANTVGEPAWAMPLPQHLRSSLDSDIADMKNSGTRYGGMLVAGLFLKEFVGDTPWAHIDIAGPSFNREGARGEWAKGATGVMLRTLVTYLAK